MTARRARKRRGRSRLPITGATRKSPESRQTTSAKGTTWARMGSREFMGEACPTTGHLAGGEREQVGRVLDEAGGDPGQEKGGDGDHDHDLGDERDRLVLDARDRLENADHQADEDPRGQNGGGDLE